MTENHKMDAKGDQLKGSAKEVFGKVTDNKKTESEAKVEKAMGKVKEVAEDVKENIEGTISGLKKEHHKDDETPVK